MNTSRAFFGLVVVGFLGGESSIALVFLSRLFFYLKIMYLRLRALFTRRGNSARDKLVFVAKVTDTSKPKLFVATRDYSFS